MKNDYMTTKEVADYLGVHEKQVYALIKENRIPCTRLTGKWIFPKHLIDEWLELDARSSIGMYAKTKEAKPGQGNYILAAGSNDPILDILLNDMQHISPGINIFSSSTGSTKGIKLLADGITDIAFCHLLDPETGEYNIPFIKSYMNDKKIAVIHLFYREIGFISSPALKEKVKSFNEIKEKKLRFINRQKGSGTRVLLDYLFEKNSIKADDITGYENEASTHFEVCLAILSNEADAGIATISAAKLLGLPFEPIKKESFDMVLPHSTFFNKSVQTFINALMSDDFKKRVSSLGEYDFTNSGGIIYSST
ncbi:MAG: substrate-binding domain-containing protein [Spirochaetota bacterium]